MKTERRIVKVPGGYALLADSHQPSTFKKAMSLAGGKFPLIVTDPPYGNIVDESWDKTDLTQEGFAADMISSAKLMERALLPGGALYFWGGLGRVGFRPFFVFLSEIEKQTGFEMSSLICWSKRRAYGLKYSYLFTREDCAYFVKGSYKKPRTFNIPLLDEERGYAGFNPDYPAKSKFYRRTQVWTDINEIFQRKRHQTQKPTRLFEVPVEVHTEPGEWVFDPFAGSGTLGRAAQENDRRFVVVEKDPENFEICVDRLRTGSDLKPHKPKEV